MESWIKKMNEMFAENGYTNDGRVSIIIVDAHTVRVTVLSKSVDINIDGLTDYGIMMIIMSQVDGLYADDDYCLITLTSKYYEYIN